MDERVAEKAPLVHYEDVWRARLGKGTGLGGILCGVELDAPCTLSMIKRSLLVDGGVSSLSTSIHRPRSEWDMDSSGYGTTTLLRFFHPEQPGMSHHLAVMQPEAPTTRWEEVKPWVAFSASCPPSAVMSGLAARFGGTLYHHELEPGRRVEPQSMPDGWMDRSTSLLADMAAQSALAALAAALAKEGVSSLERSATSVLSSTMDRVLTLAMFEPDPDDVMAAAARTAAGPGPCP